jgi:hypothetical protein
VILTVCTFWYNLTIEYLDRYHETLLDFDIMEDMENYDENDGPRSRLTYLNSLLWFDTLQGPVPGMSMKMRSLTFFLPNTVYGCEDAFNLTQEEESLVSEEIKPIIDGLACMYQLAEYVKISFGGPPRHLLQLWCLSG